MVAEPQSDGAMDRPVALAASFTFAESDVLILATRNIFQVVWDLARATGQRPTSHSNRAGQLLDVSRTNPVPQRGPNGVFGPECTPRIDSTNADELAGSRTRALGERADQRAPGTPRWRVRTKVRGVGTAGPHDQKSSQLR